MASAPLSAKPKAVTDLPLATAESAKAPTTPDVTSETASPAARVIAPPLMVATEVPSYALLRAVAPVTVRLIGVMLAVTTAGWTSW